MDIPGRNETIGCSFIAISLLSLVPGARIQIHHDQDYFMEHGPNGTYLCLVYQLAGPGILSMSFCPGRFEGRRRLRKDWQFLCRRIRKINSQNHSDISPTNVLFAEDVATWTDEELYLNLGKPKTDPSFKLGLHYPRTSHTSKAHWPY